MERLQVPLPVPNAWQSGVVIREARSVALRKKAFPAKSRKPKVIRCIISVKFLFISFQEAARAKQLRAKFEEWEAQVSNKNH